MLIMPCTRADSPACRMGKRRRELEAAEFLAFIFHNGYKGKEGGRPLCTYSDLLCCEEGPPKKADTWLSSVEVKSPECGCELRDSTQHELAWGGSALCTHKRTARRQLAAGKEKALSKINLTIKRPMDV